MPVSAYIVRAKPGKLSSVIQQLSQLEACLVGAPQDLTVPVSISTDSDKNSKEVGAMLNDLPDVEQSILVYHNFEDIAYTEKQSV